MSDRLTPEHLKAMDDSVKKGFHLNTLELKKVFEEIDALRADLTSAQAQVAAAFQVAAGEVCEYCKSQEGLWSGKRWTSTRAKKVGMFWQHEVTGIDGAVTSTHCNASSTHELTPAPALAALDTLLKAKHREGANWMLDEIRSSLKLPLTGGGDIEVMESVDTLIEQEKEKWAAECRRFHEEGTKCATCGRYDLDGIDALIQAGIDAGIEFTTELTKWLDGKRDGKPTMPTPESIKRKVRV